MIWEWHVIYSKNMLHHLGFGLDFQHFENALENFPGDYSEPDGCILLVRVNGEPAGCVALRKFDDGICEMKRMYVRPNYRGQGMGRTLAKKIIEQAKAKGYSKMRLDTASTMEEAVKLYGSMGFKEIEPYRYNPLKNAKYFELDLDEKCNYSGHC
ncbi:MAG: GNAT family N-acetyltransferase [Candidatus Edwardsbacteria bacterium]|nr:GNAT family N-acetyltransferase [Candidatus Edwardsbacteria bacterium]